MDDKGLRRFTMGACVGRGGHGEVYRCSMRSAGGLDTTVAVKVLREDAGLGDDGVRRLRDEGRMLARLNHPTIVRIMDMVLLAGRPALITEYIDGADLSDCVRADPPMGVRAQIQAIAQVASALAEARRSMGLVHRDLKPTNIRIGRHGQVKLIDFGIATAGRIAREASTHTDAILGSIPYMSPERFSDRRARSEGDVFSLGCVLYEGLTGERLYGRSATRLVPDLSGDRERFDAFMADRLGSLEGVPAPVRELIATALRYAPDDRITAAAFAATCEELGDELGGPSLRMWCRDVSWAGPHGEPGPLSGQVLTEAVLVLDFDQEPSASDETTGPSIHLQPLVTLDTSRADASQLAEPAPPAPAPASSVDDGEPRLPTRPPTRHSEDRSRLPWWLAMGFSTIAVFAAGGALLAIVTTLAYLSLTR